MRAFFRGSVVAFLALAATVPAAAGDRQVMSEYTLWQQTNLNQAEGLPGVFPGWMQFQAFTPENAASVSIADASGNPVAGVITEDADFPGAWHTFCGSGGPIPLDLNVYGYTEFFVRVVAGNGPGACGTSLPTRGTVTVTVTVHSP